MEIIHVYRSKVIPLGLLMALNLAGCQALPEHLDNEVGPLFRRGMLTLEEQGIKFTPCFVQKSEWIEDHTGRLQSYLQKDAVQASYAELSGDHLQPGAPWQVYQAHLLGGSQLACRYELSGSLYRAAGESPLWSADIRENGIYIQNYGRFSQLIFPLSEPTNLGGGYEWRSDLKGFGAQHLTLKLLRQRCRDQYGVIYEYTAEMELNGQTYSGCGREGSLDLRTLPGLYSAKLAGVRDSSRFVMLDLTSDGKVLLTQDYRNNQPLIEQKGSWQSIANGRVIVHLTETDGSEDNEVLVFERDQQGRLQLKGYSVSYGQAGLRLDRVGPERSYRKFNRAKADL